MQMAEVFQSEFNNILNIHVPRANAASDYTQCDRKLNLKARSSQTAYQLAVEINRLVNMLTLPEEQVNDESKFAEKF